MRKSDSETALIPVQSTALTKGAAKSLVARGRADLRVKEEAEEWLKRGVEFRDQGCYEEAFACFQRGIELNPTHSELLCHLADAYHMGHGVQENDLQAAALYRQAAEQGNVEGQVSLGWHYHCGAGVPLNNVEAVKWWRIAAEQGDAGAQFCLASLYENGLSVPKDLEQAVCWYLKAAEQGNEPAKAALATLRMGLRDENSPQLS